MAAAAEWALRDRAKEQEREQALRDRLWERIAKTSPAATQNGGRVPRLANTLNASFAGLSSETILMALDLEGVCASSGSACMVGSVVASHVLLAMGLPASLASSAIRFSLGCETTEQQIDEAAAIVGRVLGRIRSAESNVTAENYAVA
jgi:cysteine desulfurase